MVDEATTAGKANMTSPAWRQVDELLRGVAPGPRRELPRLLAIIFVFGLIYGAVMGCSNGLAGNRALQPLYSGLKVPLLLLVTFLLSVPSFYVLNTLLGLAGDFPEVLRALLSAQAILTIVLASLAPFTAFWYASFAGHDAAILFNALVFALASVAAQWALRRRYYRPLIARHPRHRWLLRLWLLIYAFVGIQTGWVLRPFVGEPSLPPSFFRADSWGNAYLHLLEIAHKAMGG